MTRLAPPTQLFALLSPLLIGSLATPALAVPQGFVAPFESGLRWIHGAQLSDPWVPGSVTFAAQSDLVWVGTQTINRRLMLLGGPEQGVVQPVLEDPGAALSSHILAVEAGKGGDQLFSLQQRPEPDSFHRRTLVTRHSALQAGAGTTFSPLWTATFPFTANGPSLLSVDELGDTLAVAAYDNNGPGAVQLRLLSGDSGATRVVINFQAAGLDALTISADGKRTALGVAQRLLVLDETGSVLLDQPLNSAVNDLALDGDGSRLLVGMLGEVLVFDGSAGVYSQAHREQLGPNEIAKRVALSEDGSTYAVARWAFGANETLRYEVYSGASFQMLNQVTQISGGAAFQNSPVAVEMSADGQRVAFASWGKGDADPEVLLLQRGVAQPLLEIDLPGSAMGVALDPTGTKLAVLTKNLHANQLGSTGEVRLYATGEGELEQLGPARLGSDLKVRSHQPGSSFAFFLLGERTNNPTTPPGTMGTLKLARDRHLQVIVRPAQASGQADLSLPIPANSSWLGANRSVQVASRVGGQLILSETVLDPLFY